MSASARKGPKGDKGDRGDDGLPGSGDKSWRHVQASPAVTWLAHHNFGRFPSEPSIVDSLGRPWLVDYRHIDVNTMEIGPFPGAMSGEAYLS